MRFEARHAATPRVDVVIPCYNYGRYLRQCVDSVLTQPVPVRVLVIDDASPDGSGEVAEHMARGDARVTVIRHRTNHGHIRTYNEGIEWTAAEYMLLLSADDYLLPGALGRATSLMDERPDVTFSFGRTKDLIDPGPETCVNPLTDAAFRAVLGESDSRIIGGAQFVRLIADTRTINIVRTPTAVVRTTVQKRVGGYRPELPHAGDLEMWLRLAAYGSVGIIGHHQAVWRVHGRNMHRAYAGDRQLADLEQRKAAVDAVFLAAESPFHGDTTLHRALLSPLAEDALAHADGAVDDGNATLSERMTDFALRTNPRVRSTVRWWRVRAKQHVGVDGSRRVSTWLARVRRLGVFASR